MRKSSFGNKHITVISIVFFIIISCITGLSEKYMSDCIRRESTAQHNRQELRELGEQLAETSDYLTEQARQYSLSGDMEYLYNYWDEVIYMKSRENAVDRLSAYNPPEKEKNLLSNAKIYSDDLIKTEIVSMKLMFIAKNYGDKDYSDQKLCEFIEIIENAELPEEYRTLSRSEMAEKSSEILYDYFYAQSKTQIMTPIDEFQCEMNNRLDNDVIKAEQGIKNASLIQRICSVVAILFIILLLAFIEFLYIKPLRKYTDILENQKSDEMSKLRVKPDGAYELFHFGEVFNHLALILENELFRREQAEQQADRANNAKSEFMAQMSHELRTPLNAITGCLYLLNNTSLDSTQKEYSHSIEVSAENLLGLINNVLDFSKIESGYMKFEEINYNFYSLIDEIINIMKIQAVNKGISLTADIDVNIPEYIKGDPLRIKQVIINLISNAIKFTDSGEVRLRAEIKESLPDKITAEFSVSDTGIGISPDDCKKIFDPFVQSDAGATRKYGGTGLGLSIANMIVKNLSGGEFEIKVEPNQIQGSVFKFNVYLYYGEKTVEHKISDNSDKIDENISVLLVDDNEINLTVEKKILCSYGINVVTAMSGYEALKTAENTDFSMILLDLHMPDIDGFETAKQLRRLTNCRFTPIIALTADVVSGIKEKVISAEMNDYISKPFRPEILKNMIAEYTGIIRQYPENLVTDSNKLFDSESCLENLDGDKNTLINLIESFLKCHGKSGEYIEIHIRNGHFGNARNILHDIKGISGNLCCIRLCMCSEKLLRELHGNSFGSLGEFSDIWRFTVNELNKYFAENHIIENQADKNFYEIFKKFLDLCSSYDITAVDVFQDNRNLFRKNMEKNNFNHLEKLVNCYNFKAVCREFKRSD
ncbi:MAG: ATP-binding protein [Alistipes sp.]|nr:ATP-binding protein [Alistipes sp.]